MARRPEIDGFIRFDPASAKFEPVLWKRSMLPAWLTFDPNRTNGLLTIPAAGSGKARTNFMQPLFSVNYDRSAFYQTPFEARNLMFEDSTDGTASANFSVMFTEIGDARRYMNAPIHVRLLAGTAQFPSILREPILFPSLHVVQGEYEKYSGGSTTMRMAFGGVNYYPWGPDMDLDPEGARALQNLISRWEERRKFVNQFWMRPEDDITLNGNASTTAIAKVGDDAHYEAFALVAIATGAFSLEIQEVRQKGYLMNAPLNSAAWIGTALRPTIFSVPYLIPADSKVLFRFTDLSGSSNTIRVAMQGRRIAAPLRDVRAVLADTAIPTIDQPPADWPKDLAEEEVASSL